MTADQFAALAKLARLRESPSATAARLVLVDGLDLAEAARQAGCSYNAAWQSLQTCRAVIELARVVASGELSRIP